jgi:hypothetical protein
MKSCAIMQPTYLPWAGYFQLIAAVDQFVLLDDVQFERSSWQHRNKILLHGAEHMISIPTKRMPLSEALLHRMEICTIQNFKVQHWKILEHAYRKAKHGDEALQLVAQSYATPSAGKLVNFTGPLIQTICSALSISTPIAYASQMQCSGRRSDHVAEICQRLQCGAYLSPQGAAAYLAEDSFAQKHGIELRLQNFKPKPYPQYKSKEFISHLSIMDVIANLGLSGARQYIREQA